MKKLLTVLAIFALVFAACEEEADNENNGDNSDVIGIWTARYGTDNAGEVKLDIASSTWALLFTDPDKTMVSYNGTWTRSGNTLTLSRATNSNTATASLSGDKLILNQIWDRTNSRPGTCELTKSGSSGGTLGSTTLKIKNESSKTIADVLWNNVSFKDNSSGTSTDILGTWVGSYDATTEHTAGEIEFEIGRYTDSTYYDGTWSLLYKDSDGKRGTANGVLNRNGINISIYGSTSSSSNGTASLSGNKLVIRISNNPIATDLKNRAGDVYELTKTGEPFKSGTNVTKEVEAGSGYIFFKVGTAAYRTRDLVVVEKDDEAEFTFNDYTLIVNIVDPNNTAVTLGGL